MQLTDVTEGLESTLVMLAHRIGDGVTVVRDYGADVPRIDAIAGELNQVWTNLIDNAIDAMAGDGTLRVSTSADGKDVVVEVGDTGSGLSHQALDHAFEPFFTTKASARAPASAWTSRVASVDRHGGEIAIDPRPGETVFRVRLPLHPPPS